jgi:predicted NACHT family NTPase
MGSKQLPLFVPLVKARGSEEEHLIQACVTELALHGFQKKEVSPATFLSLAKAGRFRLFLDGLDELGSNSKPMLRTIDKFLMQHESCPIIVSCRNTFKIPWEHALTVSLQPLTDEQIGQFIKNWFTAEPSSQEGLLSWLGTNTKIREATRTHVLAIQRKS